jgi:hypothetical protein
MKEEQVELLNKIRDMLKETTQLQIEYWKLFSALNAWQFWLIVLMLVVPLIVLIFSIDRSKILLLGFFGLNYHVWFAYVNVIGINLGLWEYPYQIAPFLPSFALDASFVPVTFMLLYQWTLNHNKSIYLYSILLSILFAFVLKPIMVSLDLFQMYMGVNYFHLFLFYLVFFIVSKLITNLFLWLQQLQDKKKEI